MSKTEEKIDLWKNNFLSTTLSSEECQVLVEKYYYTTDENEKLKLRNKIVEGSLYYVAHYVSNYCIDHADYLKCQDIIEDLMQIGTIALMESIMQYKPYNAVSFNVYLNKNITNAVAKRLYKEQKNATKSFEKLYGNPHTRPQVEEKEEITVLYDQIAENDAIDYILKHIIPKIKNQRGAKFFIEHYLKGKSYRAIAKEYGITGERVRQITTSVKRKVMEFLREKDNSDTEEVETQDLYKCQTGIIKKYNAEVLSNFCYKLAPKTAEVFESVLKFKGQSKQVLARQLNISVYEFDQRLIEAQKKLEYLSKEFEKRYIASLQAQENPVQTKPIQIKKHPRNYSLIEEINKTRALIDELGKDFVKDFFLPSLTPAQQRFFNDLYLNPKYSSYFDYSKENGIVKPVQRGEILRKLEELALDSDENEAIESEIKEYKTRIPINNLIKDYGGAEFLNQCFRPSITSPIQRMVFDNYIVKGRTVKDTQKDITAIWDMSPRCVTGCYNNIKDKLENFKQSFGDDYDRVVEEFYSNFEEKEK